MKISRAFLSRAFIPGSIFIFLAIHIWAGNAWAQPDFPDWAIGPFTRYQDNPVLVPEGNGWESANAYNPAVIRRGGEFCMLYRGENKDPRLFKNLRSQIGLAWSDDGIHWEKYEHNPVIRAEWEIELPGGVEDPRLIKHNGTYYAYYTAYNYYDKPDIVKLCVATSKDLINWKKHGPIFGERKMKNAAVLVDPQSNPVKINGKFVMYSSVDAEPYISYSVDLIHWELKKLDQVKFPEGFSPWEFCIALTDYEPSGENIIVFLGGRLNGGPNSERWHYALGQTLFKKDDPEKLVDIMEEPFLIPHLDYELSGFVNYTLFFETILRHDDKWWIWYGGADHVTCLATAPVKKQD
jgi:predicted GH43/DUF377 family glycosyl hydrolase